MEKKLFLQPKTHIKIAIISSLLSSLSFAIMLCISKTSLKDCSINQISFFKSFFSMFLTIVFIFFTKGKNSFFLFLKTNRMKIHAIRSLSGLATIYLFLISLKTVSLAEANLLFNTTPLFVPLLSYLWKKTPINHKIWPGLFIAFLGMIFLLHPESHWSNPGIWIALLAGAIGAITIIAVRFSHASEPVYRTMFYYGIFSLVFSGLIYCFEGFSFLPLCNLSTALSLFGIGAAGFFCQIFFTLSVKYAPAKFIAPFSYAAVIFGLGLDLFFWRIHIALSEILGMLLIFLGLYFVIFLLHEKQEKTEEEPILID